MGPGGGRQAQRPAGAKKIKKGKKALDTKTNVCYLIVAALKRLDGEMDEKKIMMAALEKIGWGREGLAQRAGYAGATAITNKLQTKKSMRVDTFVKIMAAMGYEVVVRSISKQQIGMGCFV